MTTLAIAGGTGGCGRTTTTLGLAIATADRDRDGIALDAVPDLPDLHRLAGVPPEPTVAALADGTAIEAVAAPIPNGSGARIIPGSADRTIDRRRAVERARQHTELLLIDCPSGLSPYTTRPITLADGTVLVVPPTESGRRGAHQTAVVAETLDAPVRATVVVGCEEPPEWVDRVTPGRPSVAVPPSEPSTRRQPNMIFKRQDVDDRRVRGAYRQLAAILGRRSSRS